MPRKPRGHCQSVTRPITFSRFARSAAQITAARSSNSRMLNLRSHDISPSKLLGNGSVKKNLRGKDPQSESSDEDAPEEVVQADFAFFDPKPDDFHGVKTLLQNYLDDKQWDLSGLVDLVLAQTTVGTVVKIEDDEDNALFALLTALNLGRYKDQKSIIEIKGYLLKVCQDNSLVRELKSLLEDQAEHVGLIVSQRVMNLPPQLLPHLYDGLFDEISWATEDEPTEDLRKSFRFKYYVLMTKFYKKVAPSEKGSTSTSNDNEDVIYLKPEDELFYKLSLWSFTFPLQNQQPAPHELKNYRLMGIVMAFEANKVPKFRKQLRSLIDE